MTSDNGQQHSTVSVVDVSVCVGGVGVEESGILASGESLKSLRQ